MIKWMLVGAMLCAGCGIEDEKRAREVEQIRRGYKHTEAGLRYFVECIEGYRFVITHAGHGMVAAGPIGECDAP